MPNAVAERAARTIRPFQGFDSSTVSMGALMSPTVVGSYKAAQTERNVYEAIQVLLLGSYIGGAFRPPPKCALCGEPLGTRMKRLGRYEWLEGSEHYLTAHRLWPPRLGGLVISGGRNLEPLPAEPRAERPDRAAPSAPSAPTEIPRAPRPRIQEIMSVSVPKPRYKEP